MSDYNNFTLEHEVVPILRTISNSLERIANRLESEKVSYGVVDPETRKVVWDLNSDYSTVNFKSDAEGESQ